MVIKVGINGFGRIGRVVFRTCLEYEDIEVTAINDPAIDIEYICYLMKYDSTHGRLKFNITHHGNQIQIEDWQISVYQEKGPENVPWHRAGVHYVIEASGMFTNMEKAMGHMNCEGVRRVIITAPSVDAPILILGVNDNDIEPDTKIVSCGSSTLYCLAAIAKVLEDNFGIEEGFATSIHAMTPSLKPLDGLCLKGKTIATSIGDAQFTDTKIVSCGSSTLYCLAAIAKVLEDNFGIEEGFATSIHAMTPSLKPLDGLCLKGKHWRDHRSITQNIIPTTTGACKALGRIIPSLRNKMCGLAFRVPITNVSVLDLNVRLRNYASLQSIAASVERFSKVTKQTIIKINTEQVVSSDFIGDRYSCILDVASSIQLKPDSFKLICWYENEYSYACRVLDLIEFSDAQFTRQSRLSDAYSLQPKEMLTNDIVRQSQLFKRKLQEKPNTVHTSFPSTVDNSRSRLISAAINNSVSKSLDVCTTAAGCIKAQERLEMVKKEFSKMLSMTESLFKKSVANNAEEVFNNNIDKNISNVEIKHEDSNNNSTDANKTKISSTTFAKDTISICMPDIITDAESSSAICKTDITDPEGNCSPIGSTTDVNESYSGVSSMVVEHDLSGYAMLVENEFNIISSATIKNTDSVFDVQENVQDKMQEPTKYETNDSENIYINKNYDQLLSLMGNRQDTSACNMLLENELNIHTSDTINNIAICDCVTQVQLGGKENMQIEFQERRINEANVFTNTYDEVLNRFTSQYANGKSGTETMHEDRMENKSKLVAFDSIVESCLGKEMKTNINNQTNHSLDKNIDINTDEKQNGHNQYDNTMTSDKKNQDLIKTVATVVHNNDKCQSSSECSNTDVSVLNNDPGGITNIIIDYPSNRRCNLQALQPRKRDIYDKLSVSASSSSSNNSLKTESKKSQIIQITDVTSSLEDLDRLDKMCRIMEISDELSDKLFLPLNEKPDDERRAVKTDQWSFKKLCDKVKLDEFCDEVFGK